MPAAPQAALDVFVKEPPAADNPLVGREDVVCTPHLGASTTEAQEGVSVEIAEAVVSALKVRCHCPFTSGMHCLYCGAVSFVVLCPGCGVERRGCADCPLENSTIHWQPLARSFWRAWRCLGSCRGILNLVSMGSGLITL